LGPVALSPLTLNPAGDLRRQAPRPHHLRGSGYDDEFDWLTVFYDCFRSVDPNWIVFVGPPLLNMEKPILAALQESLGAPGSPLLVRNLDRHAQIWVPTTPRIFEPSGGAFEQDRIEAQPNHCELFRGKRVLFTLSKDNDLAWIRDWAHFHVRRHAANAVLFYDNASRSYSSDEIFRTLEGISGLDTIVVVNWPYKYGPQGGSDIPWDSDFCQYGFFEHARHRFLAFAQGCLNADVDELVVTSDGASVFEKATESRAGLVLYKGAWIENASEKAAPDGRRHADFFHRLRALQAASQEKWALAPMRCPSAHQWRVHAVDWVPNDDQLAAEVLYRHFRAITTNWKEARWHQERPGPAHMIDSELVAAMGVLDETR
jgi:hypothetical protein